jgi:DNA repair exonuclease SbcCD nuclease subunit
MGLWQEKMEQNFMKRIIFGDIHFGKKGNSHTFNKDCHAFLDFMINYAKEHGITELVFLGDWFHSRNSINVNTMKSAIHGIRKLSENFEKTIFILGNHDLYYRDSRSVHSLEFVKEFDNIVLVEDILVECDSTYVSWLTEEDYKNVPAMTTKYIFGHFEIPTFLLNNIIRMPDNGLINLNSFDDKVEYVFSGHFHKRQVKRSKKGYEIHYIGNCFPHDFSDNNDLRRGFCVLEDDKEPKYVNWKDMPNYISAPLSYILKAPFDNINGQSYAKVEVDLHVSNDEVMFIREELIKMHNLRELSFVYPSSDEDDIDDIDDSTFKSIDDIVLKALDSVDSASYDKEVLKQYYLKV